MMRTGRKGTIFSTAWWLSLNDTSTRVSPSLSHGKQVTSRLTSNKTTTRITHTEILLKRTIVKMASAGKSCASGISIFMVLLIRICSVASSVTVSSILHGPDAFFRHRLRISVPTFLAYSIRNGNGYGAI